ncbi:hypothetical protein ABW19_dt0210641 [Dactylella cylindrospora]|nr:hypothetical protein ABW19_dt0210641 [Dactylella cylindrospora]
MAHLRRNLNNSPPPMSPATTSAHNFYNTFAPRRGNASPPPSMYATPGTPVPQAPSAAPPRPASAMPSAAAGGPNQYYQAGGGYVNAQYYQNDRQPPLSAYGLGPQSPGHPPPSAGYGSLNVGPSGRRTPPPPPSALPPIFTTGGYASRPIQSATFAPNHQNYGRPSPPPLNINPSFNASVGNIIRRPASATGMMPGAFPDEVLRESSPRNDLPLRANPVLGIKAAARQRDQASEQPVEEAEAPKPDSYWGDLFDKTTSPPTANVTLHHFLRGIADYIVSLSLSLSFVVQ